MLRRTAVLGGLVLLAAPFLTTHAAAPPASAAPLTGRWLVTLDLHGTPVYLMAELRQEGQALSGTYGGQQLKGSIRGSSIHFVAEAGSGRETVDAVLADGSLSGSIVGIDDGDRNHPDLYRFTATRAPERPIGPPRRHEFVPSIFHREFSALNQPVLTVSPGDTIQTTTVDAGGTDERGQKRVLGGNPETGPFFVESAMPGDTLVVHLTRLRLNRDYAVSDDAIVDRALGSGLAVKMKDGGRTVRWHLDLARGLAAPETPGEHTAHYSVPVRPMLGCIATAPPPVRGGSSTGDSGFFGGNMDFNAVVEGATVYLPVAVPGALLYLGDGHALQGDGELNGNALETSMDVELTVDVIPGRRVPSPRVESDTKIMAMGFGGSIDDAFRNATSNMALWLADDYKLTPTELAEVLGSAAEYSVSEVADRNAGVVLKIRKDVLKTLD